MSEATKIQWCDYTWNPWIGCTKLVGGRVEGTRVYDDPACFNCYAATIDQRRYSRIMDGGTKEKPVTHWGNGATRHVTKTWDDPVKWNRKAFADDNGEPDYAKPRVFCGSLCDWADTEVSDDVRSRAFDVVDACPNMDWMLLSKREQKAMEFLVERYGKRLPDYIWLGFSAGTQEAYSIRQQAMNRVTARVKFFSFEPLFENILLSGGDGIKWFDLAIYGGESGDKARAQNIEHIRSGVKQCRELGITPFVKQLGHSFHDRLGNRVFLEDPKGGDMAEWPEDLRVREMPHHR